MSHPVPAIVVTLPARTCAEARRQMEEAKTGGADLVEMRLDRFSSDQFASIGTLFPAPLPTIATLRSRAEGGEGPDNRETRARVLRELARHPFRWIDVESARDFPLAEGLARPGVLDLVVSTHLRETVRGSEWVRQLREPIPNGAVRKLVGTASVGQALRELMPGLPPPGEIPLAAMTTGPSGPLFRVWSRRLGFSFVFASLPRRKDSGPVAPVEPSQIPVDRLRRFLDADGTPPLFGVVGHPVAHSRSPDLHARWMRDEDRLGLYVALDVESDQEFAEVLPTLIEGGFRGLNITHPLKEVALGLADRVGPGAAACGVANTLTVGPEEVEAENTDLVAILRRMGELRSSGRWDGSSVGVLGAGGAARATLAA